MDPYDGRAPPSRMNSYSSAACSSYSLLGCCSRIAAWWPSALISADRRISASSAADFFARSWYTYGCASRISTCGCAAAKRRAHCWPRVSESCAAKSPDAKSASVYTVFAVAASESTTCSSAPAERAFMPSVRTTFSESGRLP